MNTQCYLYYERGRLHNLLSLYLVRVLPAVVPLAIFAELDKFKLHVW